MLWNDAKIEPTEEGWYACLHDGDSEHDDMGGVIYDFDPYVEFAFWTPASQAIGFMGFSHEEIIEPAHWSRCMSEPDAIIGWCGPFDVPLSTANIKENPND